MPNRTFNLTGLAQRLFAEGRLNALAGKIRRAQDLASLHADLAVSLEYLDTLGAMMASTKASSELSVQMTHSALLTNAIILYARATKTDSDERRGFDIRNRLNPQQAATHQELVDLRDKAIAHFGSGGSYVGNWAVELVILDIVKGETRVAVASRRVCVDKKLVERARLQVESVSALIKAVSRDKIDELTAEINEHITRDADGLKSEIEQHPLNLNAFLTSEDAVDEARSARDQGHGKGVVHHG